MADKELTRRGFLLRVGATAVLVGGVVLSGRRRALAAQPVPDEDISCTDTSGLSEQQVQTRKALKYTDNAPKPAQICENCQHYQPATDPKACGRCAVVPGPVHPQGWCTAWTPAITQAG